MKTGDIEFLNQLVNSLSGLDTRLEKAYQQKDFRKFDSIKKLILQIQRKILEVVR